MSKILKNNNISMLDSEQMVRKEHDAQYEAKRVIIVGEEGSQIAESIKESLKDLKIEVSQQGVIEAIKSIKLAPQEPKVQYIVQKEYEKIEIPSIIKEFEIKEVQVPVIVTETKIVEIERPIVVPEVRIIEIEKQVIVPEYRLIDFNSNLIKALLVIQTIAILLSLFLRK